MNNATDRANSQSLGILLTLALITAMMTHCLGAAPTCEAVMDGHGQVRYVICED